MLSAIQEIHTGGRKNGRSRNETELEVIRLDEPLQGPWPGRCLNRLELPPFTLMEIAHPPGTVLPPHAHATPGLCLTLAGDGIESSGAVVQPTRPGTLIIRPPGEIHTDRYGAEGLRSFGIEVNAEWLKIFRPFGRVFEDRRHFTGGMLPSMALRIYKESRINDNVAPIVVEGLMLELLGFASRWFARPELRLPRWLGQVKDILHGHFHDQLSLVQIAEAVGVHPTHLARSFKRHFHTTVGEYVRRLRLDWACRQLSETEDSIAEIAAAAGFYDQSHFSHTFKQHTGLTPVEFRAALTK